MPLTMSKEGKTVRLLNDAINRIVRVKSTVELDTANRENLDKAIDDIVTVLEVNKKLKEIVENSL